MIGEFARERLERRPGLLVPALGRGRVGIDQERVGPPRRAARRHPVQEHVRRAREQAELARVMVGELQLAERRVEQLAPLRGQHAS